jgi:ABC-type sugar transport system ATPase subunit
VLEDVVRTCDSVIVMREGRIAATRRIAQAGDEQDAGVQVQVEGDVGRFVQAATALGLRAERRDGWVLVDGADAASVLRGVRDAACTAEVGLRQLRPAGPTLEESLIGAIG